MLCDYYYCMLCYCVCRYVRAEIVAGFVNALFLLFVAFFIFSEAIEVRMGVLYSD